MEMTEAEFAAMMEPVYAEMEAEEKRDRYSNERLLKRIGKIRGSSFEKNLRLFLTDIGGVKGCFEIAREPKGEFVREKWGPIGGHWVDQIAVGDTGDSFAGEIYIQVKAKRFLKVYYSC